jgi:hypothetical protein
VKESAVRDGRKWALRGGFLAECAGCSPKGPIGLGSGGCLLTYPLGRVRFHATTACTARWFVLGDEARGVCLIAEFYLVDRSLLT